MIRNVLEHIGGLNLLSIIGLILFLTVFIAMTVWALRLRRPYIDHMGKLPLEDDQSHLGKEKHS